MNKSLILIFCAALAAHVGPVASQEKPPTKKTTEAKKSTAAKKKKPVQKNAKKAAAPVAALVGTDEEEQEPDITASTATDYSCEMGNKLTIYTNQTDDKHIGMRWKKRLLRLTRVDTTTGAHRFENRRLGFVWLGIPAKGILLDSKKGQQLANECKNAEQMMQSTTFSAGAPSPATSLAPKF
jgi:hypothetical protein